MPGILYYLPGRNAAPTPAEIETLGLTSTLNGPLSSRQVACGPDGGLGIVLAAAVRVPAELVGYFPGNDSAAPIQRWQKLPGSETWAGVYADARRPTPADLRRPTAIAGHPITLLDGQIWEIPVPRAFAGEPEPFRTSVPRKLDFNDAGELVFGEVVPDYRRLYELAVAWFEQKCAAADQAEGAGGPVRFRYVEDVVRAACEVLGANYAIGYGEAVGLLGLLTQELAVQILDLAADMPHIEDWLQKKTAAETASAAPSASPGPEASVPATTPASPSSGPSNGA